MYVYEAHRAEGGVPRLPAVEGLVGSAGAGEYSWFIARLSAGARIGLRRDRPRRSRASTAYRPPKAGSRPPPGAALEVDRGGHVHEGQRHELLTVIDEETDRLNRLVGEAAEMSQLDLATYTFRTLSMTPTILEIEMTGSFVEGGTGRFVHPTGDFVALVHVHTTTVPPTVETIWPCELDFDGSLEC